MKPRCIESLAARAAVALSAALCACAGPPAAAPAGSDLTGGLVVVRLLDRLDPPIGVQLDVSSLHDGPIALVGGRRQQSVPGRFADYLVSVPLKPGHYLVTAIREISDAGSGAKAPGKKLASMTAPFDVGAAGPVYLGRWVLSTEEANAAAPLEAQDHYDEDTLLFRSAIGALHDVVIGRAVVPDALLAPTVSVGKATPTSSAALRALTVGTLATEAGAGLAAPAREAFAKFLRLRAPRAFAVGAPEERAFAYSSGAGAVERALSDCSRSSTTGACRLFAVDDLWMSSLSCGASQPGGKPAEEPQAACVAAARGAP